MTDKQKQNYKITDELKQKYKEARKNYNMTDEQKKNERLSKRI